MIVKIDFGFSPPWFVVWILIPCFKFIESQTVDFVLARLVCLFVCLLLIVVLVLFLLVCSCSVFCLPLFCFLAVCFYHYLFLVSLSLVFNV